MSFNNARFRRPLSVADPTVPEVENHQSPQKSQKLIFSSDGLWSRPGRMEVSNRPLANSPGTRSGRYWSRPMVTGLLETGSLEGAWSIGRERKCWWKEVTFLTEVAITKRGGRYNLQK